MGPKYIIMVIYNDEIKVAQYCQRDINPAGAGIDILNFCRDPENLEKLRSSLDRVRFIDEEKEKDFIETFNNSKDKSDEHLLWFKKFANRRVSTKILTNIIESTGEILLIDSSDFPSDPSCEWTYVINLDLDLFEISTHTRMREGTYDRSYISDPYVHVVEYDLNNLPSDDKFLNDYL